MFQKMALSVLSIWLIGVGALAAELFLTAPPEGAVMPLLNPVQKAYVTMPRTERIEYFADAKKRKELSASDQVLSVSGHYPLPVTLSWEAIDLPKAEFT